MKPPRENNMPTIKDKYLQYLELQKEVENAFKRKNIKTEASRLIDTKKLTKTKGGIQMSIKGHLYYDVNTQYIKSYHKELLAIEELFNDFKERLESLGFEVLN